eukprot:COSAG02_NODE_1553_length_11961_cov_5.094335_13_plen_106_part_00
MQHPQLRCYPAAASLDGDGGGFTALHGRLQSALQTYATNQQATIKSGVDLTTLLAQLLVVEGRDPPLTLHTLVFETRVCRGWAATLPRAPAMVVFGTVGSGTTTL